MKKIIDEIESIINDINDFHEFHRDPNSWDSPAGRGSGVFLDLCPKIHLRVSSESLSLDPDGDLDFIFVSWFRESDGFTSSPVLKANSLVTEDYLESLESKEGMPFWGYQEQKPLCIADRDLFDDDLIESLKRLVSIAKK